MALLVFILKKKKVKIKKYGTFNSHQRPETIISESEIAHVFESISTTVTAQAGLLIQSWSIILLFRSIIL